MLYKHLNSPGAGRSTSPITPEVTQLSNMKTILLLLAVVATAQAQSISDQEMTKLIKSTFILCNKLQEIRIPKGLGPLINAKDIVVRRLLIVSAHQPPSVNEEIPNPLGTNHEEGSPGIISNPSKGLPSTPDQWVSPFSNPPETSTIQVFAPTPDPNQPRFTFPALPANPTKSGSKSNDQINDIFNQNSPQYPSSTPTTPTVTSSTIAIDRVPTISTLSTPTTTSKPTEPAPSANAADCVCVPHEQCYQGKLNVDGVNMMPPRINVCKSVGEICCDKSGTTTKPSPPKFDLCGKNKLNNTLGNRIATLDDGETEYGEFPWMVAVLNAGDESYVCGGSLIHPQVVLTAAHCVKNSTDFIARLGDWDSQTDDEPQSYQDKKVVKTVYHPEFTMERMRHDSALLFLNSSVIAAPNIGTICLPESSDVFDGAQCVVAGWGKDHYGRKGVYRAILKKVEVPIVNHDTCQSTLREAGGMGKHYILHSSFMCAGGVAGKDACTGDGGGPLMCPHPQDRTRYVQTGVVSWGRGCAKQDVPGVYANTAIDRQWIDQQLKENSALIAQN